MPKLTNAKREHICQEYVKDLNATAAADRASYKNPNTLGPRLKAVPEVAARIAELQAEAAERNEVTVDSIADQLDEDRQLAYKLGQASAAVQASVHKGKLFNAFDERQDPDEGQNVDTQIRKLVRGNPFAEQCLRLLLSSDVDGFLDLVQRGRMTPELVKDGAA